MVFQKGQLLVREVRTADADHLVRWLSDERVLFFYEGRDQPHDLELVQERYLAEQDDGITRCIVEWEGEPIGLIRFYPLAEDGFHIRGYPSDLSVWETDHFIGEPGYWNRGIGTELIRGIVEYLTESKGAEIVAAVPQVRNTRAIRCYEKCGFRRVKMLPRHQKHEGVMQNCWLMEYRHLD
ncbi:GNAT family N-acetyltransferase [Paludifilum halophilum]|uniref:GNAT family N-acetyltransferase n=1 Tax=Paludifilum halophilum TaxID=1642702 RepID=A0A235B4S5_9BACL|nr:GNAT family N-acetyltransferase [Paludifilum halophilum]OYD07283.1 GNAT family N-acetyltransferase [Paludifilum halophilum]